MPRRALGWLEVGNINASHDVRHRVCTATKHHVKCGEPTGGTTSACYFAVYWRARARVGMGAGQGSVQVEAKGKTKSAATEALKTRLAEMIAERTSGTNVVPIGRSVGSIDGSGETLNQVIVEWLGQRFKEGHIDDGSLVKYEDVHSAVIEDDIGSAPVSSFTPPSLIAFLESIPQLRSDGTWTRTSYQQTAHGILRAAFQRAVARGLISSSAMRDVARPNPPANRVRHAARPVTLSEVEVIREAIAAQPRHAPYLLPLLDLLAGCGLRIGEALALRRYNLVGLSKEVPEMILDHHLVKVPAGKQTEGGPTHMIKPGLKETRTSSTGRKLRASRIVVVPEFVRAALAEQLTRVPADDDALVFSNKFGGIVQPNNVRRTLRNIVLRAHLPPGVSPHSYRKMAAGVIESVMSDAGESASNYIGNTASVTNEHYLAVPQRRTNATSADHIDAVMRTIAPDRFAS